MSIASHSRTGENMRMIRRLTTAIGGSLDELAARKSRVRTGWWPEMQVLTLAIRDLEGKCWPKDELLARLNSLIGEVVALFEDYHTDLEIFIEDGLDRKIKNHLAELDSTTMNAEEEFEELYISMRKHRDSVEFLNHDLAVLRDAAHRADHFEKRSITLETANSKNTDLIHHLEKTISKLETELTHRDGLGKQLESSSIRLDRSERRCIELERLSHVKYIFRKRLLSELTSDNEHLAKVASERLDALEKIEERVTRFARRNEMLERENTVKDSELRTLRDDLDAHIQRESRDRRELDEIVVQSKSLADETDHRNRQLTQELDRLRQEEQRLQAQAEELRGLMELYKDKYKKEKLANRSALGLE